MVAIDFKNDAKVKCLVKNIHSLCMFRKNCQATVQQLFADYKAIEGEFIPFREYRFQTFQQFLEASGEFEVSGQLVRAKRNGATEHIERLVAKQRSPSVMRRFTAPRFMKAAHLRSSHPASVEIIEKPKTEESPESLVDPRIKVLYGQFRRSRSTTPTEETSDGNVEGLKSFEKLERFCTINNLERPSYCSYETKDSMYRGRVSIKAISYSTNPEKYATAAEALHEAAKVAVEQIHREIKYPKITEPIAEIAVKLFDCLRVTSPNGRISSTVPDMFNQYFQLSLPANWFSTIVLTHQQFFTVEKGQSYSYLIFPRPQPSPAFAKDTKICAYGRHFRMALLELTKQHNDYIGDWAQKFRQLL